MKMRPSRVLKKLRVGQVASCVKINLSDPRVIEIAAMSGFDCVWLDMEHVPTDWATIENQIRAAKVYDCDAMVRVARGSYSSHIQPLEADASGIMVPHIMSLEDAKKVVWQTRFHPIGRRPVDGGNADGAYCMIDFQEYLKTANEQRFVVVQIEDPEPLNDLEAICELPGIDMVFFGPGDFSQGIGTPGKWDNPLITQTRKRVAEVANKKGKFAGTVGGTGNLQDLINMGYRFVSVGADVVGLTSYFKPIVEAFGVSTVSQTQSIYKDK
jgi:4-hydroxy-2-oxoheptanedioate aldolase